MFRRLSAISCGISSSGLTTESERRITMTRTARVSMFLLAGLLTLLASAAERPKLRITSLADNATVSSPTIVLRGVGADPRGKLEVTVFSDRSYVQKGNTKIN